MKLIFQMMMKVITILTVMILSSCSKPPMQVEAEHDEKFNFSRLKTWDWASKTGTLETPAAQKTSERIQLETIVSSHVERVLLEKGFSHNKTNPKLLMAWSFGEWELQGKGQNKRVFGSMGLMFPGVHGSNLPSSSDGRAVPPALNPYSSKYEQAKIEIAIIDPITTKIVWSATITDDSDFGYFTASQQDRIGRAVDQLLSGFPPQP